MKLIKIKEDHYVVVDNSEIKEGDWVKHSELDLIVQASQSNINMGIHRKSKKITHSTQPVDNVNGFPAFIVGGVQEISLQEVKELIGEKSWKGYIDGTEWEVEIVDGKLKIK